MKYLECIHCNHEFTLNEVFVSFMDENGTIIVSSCINREHPVNNVKERPGTGWVVLQRNYDDYDILNSYEKPPTH